MSYGKTYQSYNNVFGSLPEEILVNNVSKINKGKPVLDIGAGQGRNSVYLAANNFSVDAVDTSKVAVKTLSELSEKQKLQINSYHSDIKTFNPVITPYSAVLIFGLLQILPYKEIYSLIERINEWIEPGSLIFITAFGEKDSSVKKYMKEWEKEKNFSFTDGNNNFRTFLEENEILDLFGLFKTIYHKEAWGKEHHHGDGIIEKHYMVEAVFQK